MLKSLKCWWGKMFGRAAVRNTKINEEEFHNQIDGEIRQALQISASANRRVMKAAEKTLVQAKVMNDELKRIGKMSAATQAADEALDMLQEPRKPDDP